MTIPTRVLPAFIIVSGEDIAARAYAFYLDRGRADGFDREDWSRAERELKDPRGNTDTRGLRAGPR